MDLSSAPPPSARDPYGYSSLGNALTQTGRSQRGFQCTKFLPVVFVLVIVGVLYAIYVFGHCWRLLQLEVSSAKRDSAMASRGLTQLVIFNVLSFMLMLCYAKSYWTDPGYIPDSEEWIMQSEGGDLLVGDGPASCKETKRDGQRRHCKWCAKMKPDRAHHCRICRRCVLKMDHHCPWIYNCVGFHNHKFFFLLVIYATASSHMIAWTMFESVKAVVEADATFSEMFTFLFGETLAGFLAMLLTCFLSFHSFLVARGMTTIEWCEKTWRQEGQSWDVGFKKNFVQVFGPNPLFWLFPTNLGRGDGLSFTKGCPHVDEDEESRLTRRRSSSRPASSYGALEGEGRAQASASREKPPTPPLPEVDPDLEPELTSRMLWAEKQKHKEKNGE